MTETERIRWREEPANLHRYAGSVGSVDPDLFKIYPPDAREPEWLLSCRLSGWDAKTGHADDPEKLKWLAERWLEEFVSSLGASFPESVPPHPEEETGR